MLNKSVHLLHNNAPNHKVHTAEAAIRASGFKQFNHSPHSPDLVPSVLSISKGKVPPVWSLLWGCWGADGGHWSLVWQAVARLLKDRHQDLWSKRTAVNETIFRSRIRIVCLAFYLIPCLQNFLTVPRTIAIDHTATIVPISHYQVRCLTRQQHSETFKRCGYWS